MQIELGKRYREKVTGVTGIAIGITHWLTGCDTAGLTQPVQPDGKVPDTCWYDAQRLELVDDGVSIDQPTELKGGPQDTPRAANGSPS